MKICLPLGLIVLTSGLAHSGLAHAGPPERRAQPVPSSTPVLVMPISADESDPRGGGMRLRDVLRQPFDDMEDNAKPYRLSAEERQRLREQLRGQPNHDSKFKP